MAARTNLDLDALRTLLHGVELGSFARAAERVGRSQSAISLQLRKLEAQVGQPLVRRAGRGLVLTEGGEQLLGYARRMLALNDEALDMLRGAADSGWVRLGVPQDFTEDWLPEVLAGFAAAHPGVQVEVRAEKVSTLVERTLKGELDASLCWGTPAQAPHLQPVAQVPMVWIGSPNRADPPMAAGEPVPLIAFETPCAFRDPAVRALDGAAIPWRLAFSSPSLSSLWAATAAGLGITVRTRVGLPGGLVALDPHRSRLPPLPTVPLSLAMADRAPGRIVDGLVATLLAVLRDRLPALAVQDGVARG